jgi:hypothetical protein
MKEFRIPQQQLPQIMARTLSQANNAVKAIILNSLSDTEVLRVMNELTAKRMVELLDQYHAITSPASLSVVMAKYHSFKIPEGGNINQHLGDYDQICSEVQLLGGTLTNNQKSWGLLLALPASWKKEVHQIAIKYRNQAREMLYHEVRADVLEAKVDKSLDSSSKVEDQMGEDMLTRGKEREERGTCTRYNCIFKRHLQARNEKERQNDWQNGRKFEPKERGNQGREATEFATMEQGKLDENTWILDSGAYHHMLPNHSMLRISTSLAQQKGLHITLDEKGYTIRNSITGRVVASGTRKENFHNAE